MGVILGPILLLALYPRVKRWGLLWTEIMEPEEVSASRFQRLGTALVWVGGIGALILSLVLQYRGAESQAIAIGLIPFLALIVVGSFMLGGREQVEAVQEETMAAEGEEPRT